MNSPSVDQVLDDLFRRALESTAEASPPVDAWHSVAKAVRQAHPSLAIIEPSGNRQTRSISKLAGRLLRWRRATSWVHSFKRLYPPSASDLKRGGPGGRYRPSPFAGVFVTDLFELRLAS